MDARLSNRIAAAAAMVWKPGRAGVLDRTGMLILGMGFFHGREVGDEFVISDDIRNQAMALIDDAGAEPLADAIAALRVAETDLMIIASKADYMTDEVNIQQCGGEPSIDFAIGAIGSRVGFALEAVRAALSKVEGRENCAAARSVSVREATLAARLPEGGKMSPERFRSEVAAMEAADRRRTACADPWVEEGVPESLI